MTNDEISPGERHLQRWCQRDVPSTLPPGTCLQPYYILQWIMDNGQWTVDKGTCSVALSDNLDVTNTMPS